MKSSCQKYDVKSFRFMFISLFSSYIWGNLRVFCFQFLRKKGEDKSMAMIGHTFANISSIMKLKVDLWNVHLWNLWTSVGVTSRWPVCFCLWWQENGFETSKVTHVFYRFSVLTIQYPQLWGTLWNRYTVWISPWHLFDFLICTVVHQLSSIAPDCIFRSKEDNWFLSKVNHIKTKKNPKFNYQSAAT